ncbi:MAG: sulfatase-like hydrolase/transferase [Bdellovibrionales bacterium]|nr:sulfatase-like hydrolase/transferase [Bdellovibrionales bacterium]
MKLVASLLLWTLSISAFSSVCENKGPNVILFTWDGVRSHEFFKGTGVFHATQLKRSERGEIFSTFWSKYAEEGTVLGGGNRYRIASKIAISLPSYQALMVGRATNCKNNGCESIKEESVLENVRSSLKLAKKDVAVFASWDRILAATAKDPDQISHGIHPEIFDDGTQDEYMLEIQKQAAEDLPHWKGSRKDKYTFELGMHYLKKHCPRVLYISLVDSDEFGHEGDYPNYVRSLRQYDQYLDQMVKTLQEMGEYGKQTTVIVTTDHSRGPGPLWIGHANTPNSEKNVFLYARGRGVKATGRSRARASHANIRPTIEYLMGLTPTGEILPNIEVE